MSSEDPTHSGSKVLSVFLWCLPALLGFAIFLVAFPIDRTIAVWPHPNIAEVFFFWFLFAAPIATAIAIVIFKRQKRSNQRLSASRLFGWIVVIVSVLVNALVLLGLWGATY
jgi:disulfide bond formation protein DsbB